MSPLFDLPPCIDPEQPPPLFHEVSLFAFLLSTLSRSPLITTLVELASPPNRSPCITPAQFDCPLADFDCLDWPPVAGLDFPACPPAERDGLE